MMRGGPEKERNNAQLLVHNAMLNLYSYLLQNVGLNFIHPSAQMARVYRVKVGGTYMTLVQNTKLENLKT